MIILIIITTCHHQHGHQYLPPPCLLCAINCFLNFIFNQQPQDDGWWVMDGLHGITASFPPEYLSLLGMGNYTFYLAFNKSRIPHCLHQRQYSSMYRFIPCPAAHSNLFFSVFTLDLTTPCCALLHNIVMTHPTSTTHNQTHNHHPAWSLFIMTNPTHTQTSLQQQRSRWWTTNNFETPFN